MGAVSAGVSLLALTQISDAKIVYKPANIPIPGKGVGLDKVGLDLNNDGVRDVLFKLGFFARGGAFLEAYPAVWQARDGIEGTGRFESALSSGVSVGPKDNFQASHHVMVSALCSSGQCETYGAWQFSTPRYLGVRFVIGNKVHYGWIRMTVDAGELSTSVVITGYAYETNPNTAIITGKTEDGDASAKDQSQPGTLGLLARGSSR